MSQQNAAQLYLIALDDQPVERTQHVMEQRLQAVVAQAPMLLFSMNVSGYITLAEGRGLGAGVLTPEMLRGHSLFEVYAERPDLLHHVQQALKGEASSALYQCDSCAVELRLIPVLREGVVAEVVGMMIEVTDRLWTEAALRHQAHHDALTGLPNRALLLQALEQALQVGRQRGGPVALLLFDLNRFREVNDTLGHHVGDLLLQQVGTRLQELLAWPSTVARLSGDEFAIVLPATDLAAAQVMMERVLGTLRAPIVLGGHTLHTDGAIGIAVSPDHGTDAATLLRHADVAMYMAKRRGAEHAIYDETQDRHTIARLTLERDLRVALAAGNFVLHYQPKVDGVTNRICGVEALVRWPHPQHGLVPPDQFIPLAEETGLIAPLTEWVLEEALRQCAAWQREGLYLNVAVNLSARNLGDPALPAMIAQLIRAHAVEPTCLTLEITESTLMADPARALRVLTELDELQVRLAVDDFGTGYSSLAYLKELPVDEVKIDKFFIKGLDKDAQDASLVCSIIGMARVLGLDVVAEGVETESTLLLLQALDGVVAQGYCLSRPLPPGDLAMWARTSAWGV